MRIVSVHLKNIKSHRDTDLTFSRGINVLSGANGSGKSTIFEAIGYALFGVSAQDFVSRAERFLTIGAKKGEIGVVFEPAEGELYRVTRTVGPAGKWLLSKETGGVFEVEEHANAQETEQRIASLLGLSKNRSLADQFKLVIGPFQNDFLGPFVIKQPTRRQDAFDEILGIDTWRKTFDGTKALAGAIQAKTDTLQTEVEGKREQVAVLPAKEEEVRGLKERLAAKRSELEARREEAEKAGAALAAIEAQKEKIESLQSELRALEERIHSGKDHVATQQLLTEQAKAAADIVAASADGKKAYDAAEERLKALREQEKQRFLAEKKLAELEKEQSQLTAILLVEKRELDELRKRLEEEGNKLALEDRSVAGELAAAERLQAEARESLGCVNASLVKFRELPLHRIDAVLPYLLVALDRMAAIDLHAAERGKLLESRGPLQAEADQLAARQRELERIQGERSELMGRRHSLLEGRDKIGAGDCPYFQEPCKNLEGGGGVEIFTSRIEALDAEAKALEERGAALAAQVASAQAAVKEFAAVEQVSLELAKSAKEREDLERDFARNLCEIDPGSLAAQVSHWLESAGLGAAYADRLSKLSLETGACAQERRARLSAWSDGWHEIAVALEETLAAQVKEAEAPAQASAVRVAELLTRRQSLEAKRRELATAGEKGEQREKSIQSHQQRLDILLEAHASHKTTLSAFSDLDDTIKGAGAELDRLQPQRDRFIANKKSADELEKRQETLSRYQARLEELNAELVAKREEEKGVAAGYLPELHEKAKTDRERLVSLVATLKAELVGVSEGIARLEGEISALTAVAEEINRKLAAIEDLKEQAALVKFLRNQVFKNVSSQLSERFREEISSRADRIYRCISDSDEELFWGDNYQIVLKDMVDGSIRERTDDQLSGGQMMSSVVALRLALLQTIGARVAFFDEPTSNLDAERRENLAKAFRAIDVGQEEVTEHWYDQLFLVSHDVSFTEITDQMIHLD